MTLRQSARPAALAAVAAASSAQDSAADAAATIIERQTQTIWLPASAFAPSSGSPSFSFASPGQPAWWLDDAATESIVASYDVPSWWNTWRLLLLIATATVGAGDVRLGFVASDKQIDPGAGPLSGELVVTADVAAPTSGADPAQVPFPTPDVEAPAAGRFWPYRAFVARYGGAAEDTKAGDLAVLGALLLWQS